MSEAITKYFKKEKNKLIRKYGRSPMSNFQIDDECNALNKYNGCFMQDEITNYKKGYYIINTDTKNKQGIHWVAMYITPKNAYIYDSYGRDTTDIMPILKKKLEKQGLKIIESDKKKEQKGNSVICGMLCIAWLLCCNRYGIRQTVKII